MACCAQTTEAEATAAEQRIEQANDAVRAAQDKAKADKAEADKAKAEAEEAAKAEQALAQSLGDDGGPRAVTISGAPQEKYNGTFGPRPKHNGWPRWGPNEGGMHLYYVPASVLEKEGPGQWQMAGDFKPEDKGFANAQISSVDGPLPVGEHAWKFWNAEKEESDYPTLMVAYR